MKKKTWRRPVTLRTTLERFMNRLGQGEKIQLVRLWQHWPMVMGDEIAALAWPLGSKNTVLVVGGEDAMVMQEISFMQWDILERANAFMGREYFSAVRVQLALDKKPLDELCQTPQKAVAQPLFTPTPLHGNYLKNMPAEHPVARCYALYLAKQR